jgi:2-oxoglutarate dehydrogenase E2 component (dihydrolipoamide succinyltransferase)
VPEPAPEPAVPAPAGNGTGTERPTFVSPVVARIAAEHGIDPSTIEGSGRDGRVTKKDILAFVEGAPQPVAPAPAATPEPQAAPPPPSPAPAPPAPTELDAGETLTPMSAMRRGIAEHMRHSLDTAAHVTSAIEVDMSKVVAIRQRLKSEYKASYGVNLTYLAFVSRATVETLRDWPYVNAEIRGESIVTRAWVNLGFAVALDEGKGLIVPVLKNAEGLNLLGMARGIADLADRARTKKLLPDDVQGGTFTITNPGSYGTFIGTPVISQPQTGILGTYAVVKRPWVVTDDAGQDAIAIRPMMNLTLTYDHRLVDGAYGGQFLRDLAQRLESSGENDY